MEKIVSRNKITKDAYREILDTETHHDHKIMKNDGEPYWKENKKVREMVDNIGLDKIVKLFDSLGYNWNSEIIRKMFRDMGYSLFGYWEVFYCNNDIAHEYKPNAEK